MAATSEDSGHVAATVRSLWEVIGRCGWAAGSGKFTVSPIMSLCGQCDEHACEPNAFEARGCSDRTEQELTGISTATGP